MQHVSRSGRPYPNIVHNVQSPALKQTFLPYIKISRICRHSRQSVVSNPSACRMVESRILYVGLRESMWLLPIPFFTKNFLIFPQISNLFFSFRTCFFRTVPCIIQPIHFQTFLSVKVLMEKVAWCVLSRELTVVRGSKAIQCEVLS